MKIRQYSIEELQRIIARLESWQGTQQQRSWDRRYLKAYRAQLERLQNEEEQLNG